MKTLEGEVALSKNRVKFTPAKRGLLTKDERISLIQKIFHLYANNSQSSLALNLKDPSSILPPHLNLQELKKYDDNRVKEIKKGNSRIIEE